MSKYLPIQQHLRDRGTSEIPMTFSEIETVLGFRLPASAREHRAWWSNNTSNSVMTTQWLAAGYETANVDLAGERLVFRRTATPPRNAPAAAASHPARPSAAAGAELARPSGADTAVIDRPRPSLHGALRGMSRAVAGTDPAEPADPEWGVQDGR